MVRFFPPGVWPVSVVPAGTVRPPLGVSAVGQTAPDDPNPVAPMGGVDGASWNNNRPAGVAFAFQVSENSIEPQRDEASNVLAQE